MLRVYKKCEKSIDNLYGIKEITDFENYDKPFMMCISAQDNIDKSVFGLIKEGARAARVRTSDEFAGGYKIDEMLIDFLGLKYEYKSLKDKKSDGLADFVYRYLRNGKDIKKQARKINFFTYCNGTNVYVEFEKKLKTMLLNDGFSEEGIKDILSQISLVSIASEIDIKDIYAKGYLFKDVNDREVFDKVSKYGSQVMVRNNRESTIVNLNNKRKDSPIAFLCNGTGEHELKEYFKDGCIAKGAICACVSYLVSNSINNSKSSEFIPLDYNEIRRLILTYNGEFDHDNKLLTKLDESFDYGVSKYTKSEHELVTKLEKSYKKLASTKRYLDSQTIELEEEKRKNRLLISEIKDKCSDVAFEQIVVSNGMWNNGGKKYTNEKTDRQIREEYELLKNEDDVLRR